MSDLLAHMLPIVGIFLISSAIFFLASEVGYFWGKRRSKQKKSLENTATGILTGSILGLVSFLLAFSFGFAASHYTERRGLVLEEANAIGTAYLRAELLPQAATETLQRQLVAYTETRFDLTSRRVAGEEYKKFVQEAEKVHAETWALVAEIARENPTPVNALVVAAVNQVIDLHGVRVAVGTRYKIPIPIWVALFVVSSIALATTGYRYGASFKSRPELLPGMVLAFACVITLIADLNSPRLGVLTADQTPMKEVLLMMKANAF